VTAGLYIFQQLSALQLTDSLPACGGDKDFTESQAKSGGA